MTRGKEKGRRNGVVDDMRIIGDEEMRRGGEEE